MELFGLVPKEKLSLTGIDKLAPDLRVYEDLEDTVLEMFGGDTDRSPQEKETSFRTLLGICSKGLLFVVDNLETIQDEDVIAFIKEVPPPHRVLITSRLGLGEIEKRYPLKSLPERDAITLFRSVAREKQLHDLASQPDEVLRPYVQAMAFYPLIIKWVLGQVSLGRSLETVVASVTSPGSDVTTFCFTAIFRDYLNDADRLALYALSTDERSMTKVVLCHLCNFPPEIMDLVLQRLTVASLVVNTAITTSKNEIQTKYELLSLTRRFVNAKLQSEPETHRLLRERIAMVQHMLAEDKRARGAYRYSLREFGAVTDEERIAATWALTAHQRYIAGAYDEALKMFETALEFAPRFAPIYRNLASIEAAEGHYSYASELLQKATALSPTDAGLWLTWGQTEIKANNLVDAISHLNKALELAPEDEIILAALADAERRSQCYEQAEDHFGAAIALMESKRVSARQRAITLTTRADNLRRWSESLKEIDSKRAVEAARRALSVIDEAAALQPTDTMACTAQKQIRLHLGHLLFATDGFLTAKPYYEQALTDSPVSDRQKRTNEIAAFIMADHLLRMGRQDEARKFIGICKENATKDSKYQADLGELVFESRAERLVGIIDQVVYNRGYGFVRVEGRRDNVKLTRESLCSASSIAEFNRYRGRAVSFVMKQEPSGERLAIRGILV